jgi:hypothetical protein
MARKVNIKPRPRGIREDAIMLNNDTFDDYCNRFYKIATSIFEWVNLPDSMDGEYLEHVLFYKGMGAMLKTEEYGFINTKATASGDFNIYGRPTQLNCYSYSFNEVRTVYNGLIRDVDGNVMNKENSECILVRNTLLSKPTFASMRLFALRLTELERTMDTNVKRCKDPYIIKANKTQEMTMRQVFQDADNNVPAIIVEKNALDLKDIDAIPLKVDFLGKDMMEYKEKVMNEALTVLGINNLGEKRERLISDETNSNNELINMNLMSYLTPRKQACKEFNEKFGLTGEDAIDVRVRSDLDNIIKREMSSIKDEFGIEESETTTEERNEE